VNISDGEFLGYRPARQPAAAAFGLRAAGVGGLLRFVAGVGIGVGVFHDAATLIPNPATFHTHMLPNTESSHSNAMPRSGLVQQGAGGNRLLA